MNRFLRYWAIRLLGREWMVLSLKAKLAGTWCMLSMFVILPGSMHDEASLLQLLLATVNMALSASAVIRMQKTNEI